MSPDRSRHADVDPVPTDDPATASESAVTAADPATGPGALRRTLRTPGTFATIVELVPWAGALRDARGTKPLKMAADLAGNPRITALSITDNAGGYAKLPPDVLGESARALGHDAIVHVACRDRNRNGMQSLGWDLLSRGLSTILALTGDYPAQGYRGGPRPVFDIDSVGLLALLRGLGTEAVAKAEADGAEDPGANDFYLGCAIDPFKRLERDQVPQLLKLAFKVRSGADYAITQVGYDAHRQDQLLRWLRRERIDLPVVANAYILSAPVARAFHAGKVPGCVVTDALLEVAEREAKAADKGRAFFLEFAARQLVVSRGLGFAGIYISGHRDAGEVGRILEMADAHPADDWRALVKDVSWGLPGAFEMFASDGAGLSTDELAKGYRTSLTAGARQRSRSGVSPFYRFNRVLHERVFQAGTPGFRAWARFYGAVEKRGLEKPLHALEHAAKLPMFDCRDCGDCSLPDIAYLCPESHCQKNQRNGPCGGAFDGQCEVPGHTCVWADAYTRLKPYGEELTMLERAPVVQDNELRRTSAWANTFLGRDHFATDSKAALAVAAPPKPAAKLAAPPAPAPEPGKGPSA